MIWYTSLGVEEWNPLMESILQNSLLLFVITKLSITFLPILLISRYINRLISQVGIGIILMSYTAVALLHYYVFLFLMFDS